MRVCCPNCKCLVLIAELASEANDGCCDMCVSGGRGSYAPDAIGKGLRGLGLGDRNKRLLAEAAIMLEPPAPVYPSYGFEADSTERLQPSFAHGSQLSPQLEVDF